MAGTSDDPLRITVRDYLGRAGGNAPSDTHCGVSPELLDKKLSDLSLSEMSSLLGAQAPSSAYDPDFSLLAPENDFVKSSSAGMAFQRESASQSYPSSGSYSSGPSVRCGPILVAVAALGLAGYIAWRLIAWIISLFG